MIDREKAREYLQRRVTEHDLGIANGADMDPDVVALSAIVLAMDDRLDELVSYFEAARGDEGTMTLAFFEAMWEALLKNKVALGAALSALVAFFASQTVQFFEVREFFGLSGMEGMMVFLALVMFIVAMFAVFFKQSHPPRR